MLKPKKPVPLSEPSNCARSILCHIAESSGGVTAQGVASAMALDVRVAAPHLNALHRRGYLVKTETNSGIVWHLSDAGQEYVRTYSVDKTEKA